LKTAITKARSFCLAYAFFSRHTTKTPALAMQEPEFLVNFYSFQGFYSFQSVLHATEVGICPNCRSSAALLIDRLAAPVPGRESFW
jgi:hypothetical protein